MIIYSVDGGQLIRSDLENARTNVIAHHVGSVRFEVIGNEMRMTVEFVYAGSSETYVFNTPKV